MGSTSYLNYRPDDRVVEVGNTWLTPAEWGTGANGEAKLLLLEHAFERLGLLRVEFKTDAANERSRAALAALPRRVRGRLPQAHARRGRGAPRLGVVCRDRRRLARRKAASSSAGSSGVPPSAAVRRDSGTAIVAAGVSNRALPCRGARTSGPAGSRQRSLPAKLKCPSLRAPS